MCSLTWRWAVRTQHSANMFQLALALLPEDWHGSALGEAQLLWLALSLPLEAAGMEEKALA